MHAGSGIHAAADFVGRDEQTLATLANQGSDEAIGEYFARNRGRLTGLANRLSGGSVDPEDLLSDALTATIARWREGRGPTSHITAYLVRAMRNRMHDEMLSPAAHTRSLDRGDEPAATAGAAQHPADLLVERRVLGRAMRAIPRAHAAVLVACVVDGRRPRELVSDFGRNASSISALLLRAKLRLRREVLAQLLRENAVGEACERAAATLPPRIPRRLDEGRGAALEHVRGCRGCRRAWCAFRQFAASA